MSGLRTALARLLEPPFFGVDEDRLAGLGTFRRGKVRDLFIGRDEIWMIATDRLSAFDVVLTTIPCKGAILNAIAVDAFRATQDIAPHHLLEVPHPNVLRVRRADPLPVEVVVRRYISGSLWRDYQKGAHTVYDVGLPEGLRRDQRLPEPIITPSTKAEVGLHDEPLSGAAVVERGLVAPDVWKRACEIAEQLFRRGEALAAIRGLILVDTKYELGLVDGELYVIDEIHTPDSSRYWVAEEYEERFLSGDPQRMLDKENIRQWLLGQGFSGRGTPPAIPDDVRLDLAERYADLHERLLGSPFVPPSEPAGTTIYRCLDGRQAGA